MGCTTRIIFSVALGLVGLVAPPMGAIAHAAPQPPTARLVAVEGASTTYALKDYDGRVVTAVVPSQSRADIQRQSTDATVHATLAAVDRATNQVKVVMQEG